MPANRRFLVAVDRDQKPPKASTTSDLARGRSCPGLLGAQYGVGAVRGEDAVGEPPAVTAGDLAVSPFVDGPGVLPRWQRLAEDVPALDDPEAMAGEERGPVGHQLGAGVVQHRPQRPILRS